MVRSLVVTLGVALALLPGAVASPSGAAAGSGSPEGTTLYPGLIARGADTPLLHMQEEVVVDGRVRVPVRGAANAWMLGRVGRDYLVETADADFNRFAVRLVRRDGSHRVLQRFGQRTTPVPSADGKRLALVTLDRPGTRIRVVRTRTGALVRQRTFASYGVEVTDYGLRRMVITGLRDRTFWWNPQTGRRTLLVARPAWADIEANRLVVRVPHPKVKYEECQRTVELSRPSVLLWRSCRDRPLTFSPDGRRMLTTDIRSDGIGPSFVQVRRVHGGLVRTYRAPGFFGFVEWEGNRRVLLQPVGPTYTAAVRCVPTGGCHRASRLYRSAGVTNPVETMRWSFP